MVIEKRMALNDLREHVKKHLFYCFGAGIQGKRWAYYLENWGVANSCLGYIDNNGCQYGNHVFGYENEYNVFSIEEAIDNAPDRVTILITSFYYDDILNQIKEKNYKNEITCIGVSIVADAQFGISTYEGVIHEVDEPIIPKTIHYAWFGNDMPDKVKRNIDKWHQICPDYRIIKWDESNYDVSSNTYMKEAYENKIWGFVPDYLRLDIIYRKGGIYLDTDIEIVRRLDDLRFQRCFGCCDSSFTMNLGSGFGAMAGCEIIRELRDYYDDIHFIDKEGKMDKTSCNTHNYHVLRKYGFEISDKMQRIKEMNIYPMIFQGACQYTRNKKITDKTFWIHYGYMSWM